MRSASWTLLPCAAFAMLVGASPLRADVCDPDPFGNPIPDCEPQVQKPVTYSTWKTSGWAYYCTGNRPYFWGLRENQVGAFTWDNSCFSVTENVFYDDFNKLDVTATNWCRVQELTVTMACSGAPPPSFRKCGTEGEQVGDPGCPQTNIQNHCSSGLPSFCAQTYDEICSDGTKWSCTNTFGIAWCLKCAS